MPLRYDVALLLSSVKCIDKVTPGRYRVAMTKWKSMFFGLGYAPDPSEIPLTAKRIAWKRLDFAVDFEIAGVLIPVKRAARQEVARKTSSAV